MGEFESVEPSSDVTYVSFQDRKTAEKLYYSLHGKELPGVDGKLELSWVNAPAGATSGAGGAASADKKNEQLPSGAAAEDEDNEEGAIGSEAEEAPVERHSLENMDYEQAADDDDEAWG
jgi:RNA-binding protein 26